MEAINIQLSSLFEWLLKTTIQGSVLIGLILLVKVILRGRLPIRWHYFLWLLLLIRLAAPRLPQSRFSIFNFVPESLQMGQVEILPLLWLLGALVMAGIVGARNFSLWRTVRRERPITEPQILDLLEDCKMEMDVKTIVGVVVSDRVKSPVLFGFVRPRLLLPQGILEAYGLEELRYIFIHELAHFKQRDIYLGWLMALLQILHWFNPLMWFAFHRMRVDRELACDGLAVSRMDEHEPPKYGRTILDLFERFSRVSYMPSIAGILEDSSKLERRIKMIAKFKKTSRKRSVGAVLVLVALAYVTLTDAYSAAGRTIYVDADASGSNNGSSWMDAYRYLQNALGAAVSGDEIRVAQGIYRPDEDSAHPTGTGSRTVTFRLKNGVVITGGYAGFGQPVPDARDPNTHETILSGDLLGNDGPDFANNYENSYHVVTGSGTDATAVLDGFTITAGNANENKNVPRGCGGGMYNQYGSPTVTNCIFSGNSASKGGGMYNNDSSPTVTNCTFSGNSVYQGGGMYNNDSSPTVTNCTFSGNSSSWTGGGMRNWESSPTVTNCMFSGNSSGWDGGGIQNASNSSSLLVNCMFAGNSAANGGGGMNNWRSSPTVTNCTFSGNSGSGFGGGMFNYESSPTVTNCTFSRNSASRGGGMSNRSSSSATVTNCILWGNSASSGPQIYNDGTSSLTVSYSDVQGGRPSAGNINSNPLFVDQAIGDYHLLTGSPCIDTGDNSAVGPSVVTDLDGNPRIIDGTVDMGAYEGPYKGFLLSPEMVVVPEGGTATFTVAPVVDPINYGIDIKSWEDWKTFEDVWGVLMDGCKVILHGRDIEPVNKEDVYWQAVMRKLSKFPNVEHIFNCVYQQEKERYWIIIVNKKKPE